MSRGSSVARTQEMAAGAAISVRGLWKAFYDERRKHTIVAVQDLSLDVPAGEFVCVVGPSGCGKTTFLRMLAGLDEPVAGTISIADGARPAMVFQDTSVFPWLTVEQNVAYPLRLRRVPRRERARRVEPLLAMTGLLDFRAAYPHQLSGGMKQRTTVARALAEDSASVLLMDEPFGALDEQTRVTLQQELLRVWEQTAKDRRVHHAQRRRGADARRSRPRDVLAAGQVHRRHPCPFRPPARRARAPPRPGLRRDHLPRVAAAQEPA